MMAFTVVKNICSNKKYSNYAWKFFKPFLYLGGNKQAFSSALYVPGNKANKTFALVSPVLDYDNRFDDVQKLQEEFNKRNININAAELKKSWEYFQYISKKKESIESKRDELAQDLKALYALEKCSSIQNKIDAGKIKLDLMREDLKVIKEVIWSLEESLIPNILKIPNVIDAKTPTDSTVLRTVGHKPEVPKTLRQNHLIIGDCLNLIDYKSPTQYYLKNEAALFELAVISAAGKIMNEANTIRISGPDFCRSVVVEGCGIDHQSFLKTFILEDSNDIKQEELINRLHLVGAGSLPALLAFHIKHIVKAKDLPLRLFSTGRSYTPYSDSSIDSGLFSTCQSTSLQAVTFVNLNDKSYDDEFENLVNLGASIYNQLGCHYRIVFKSAKELERAETKKVTFEMWSVNSSKYIEVGNVSAYGDYLNKRLIIGYQGKKGNCLSAVISGTLLSVPKVLGCLIEENPKKFIMPKKLITNHESECT
ncbi:serine--tRNA synthetase-like protein Slimp [Trichogramma pretiosum]|uniref:serine--tRNA synthetase-like protein Slimp n=1 Tax=Trichogramma pretiosum TaxID=7493 RepID=UPI0006C95C64|nr:serine--tRNA synthetase-like protein Slimp [Trichogramma pretiosum]